MWAADATIVYGDTSKSGGNIGKSVNHTLPSQKEVKFESFTTSDRLSLISGWFRKI